MNERERSELEFLKRRQESLSQELAALAKQLADVEARLGQKVLEPSTTSTSTPAQAAGPAKVAQHSPPPLPTAAKSRPAPAITTPVEKTMAAAPVQPIPVAQ